MFNCFCLTFCSVVQHTVRNIIFWKSKGWFTLGLRKAEQSLKTGLFYYDDNSMPCSAQKFLHSRGNWLNFGLSRDGVDVLRIIQEGGVFMHLHNISGRKSSSNALYRYWNDRTCVLQMELHLDYCSFKNNSWVQ